MGSQVRMKRKKFSTYKALSVLFVTVIIFSIGVFVGNTATKSKFEMVSDLSRELQIQTLGVEVEYDILRENICENDNVLYLTQDLAELSEKLNFMENNLGYDDPRVAELKQYYFVLEAKHWLLAKQRTEQCLNQEEKGINNTIILYFYDNENNCDDCQKQGTVLTHLQKKYKGIKIYSFDTSADNAAVKVLKKLHGIREYTPSLVINSKAYEGYMDANSLEEYIANQLKIEQEEELMTVIE